MGHSGNFKAFHGGFPATALRPRVIFSVIMIFVGLVLVVSSVAFVMAHAPPLNWIVLASLGVLLIAAGLVLLITDLMETWLTRGQSALVDGLQAG
jgi:uncharacterized membrane protein HdeD (DUF308 family)